MNVSVVRMLQIAGRGWSTIGEEKVDSLLRECDRNHICRCSQRIRSWPGRGTVYREFSLALPSPVEGMLQLTYIWR